METKQNDLTYWQQQIANWRNSGLKQKEYCEQNGLIYTTFGYWRSKLNKSLKKAKSRPFSRVKVAKPSGLVNLTMRIKHPGGLEIELPMDIENAQLKKVLKSLGDLS